MSWQETDLTRLERDLESITRALPPPAWQLDFPRTDVASRLLRGLSKWEPHVHAESGGFDAVVYGDAWDAVLSSAISVVTELDPGRIWFAASDEERSREELVAADVWSAIEDRVSVGPGGRVRAVRLPNSVLIEGTARRRTHRLGGEWRRLGDVMDSVRTAIDEAERRMTLRFAFGYHEASKFEQQRWLRPAYVFLIEQPSRELGLRWRVALVEAATDVEGLPPNAGLEGSLGHCG